MENSRPTIRIDLNDFKLHLRLRNKTQLTLHFNSPSRRFYLSVIALLVNEMKNSGKIKTISLKEHMDLVVLLNESVGGAAGSSDKESLLTRIYVKWKNALPNLEEAPLFKVLGKKKEEGDGGIGKIYSFTDAEKDGWANLFDYIGSKENVRLKFAIDKIGIGLNETSIIFGDSLNEDAWDQFISGLKRVASVERMKYPLPDVPSIAVLPFVNMSDDPKQEFLCDGMTDQIITALCKIHNLFVISRQSTFFYKGKPVKVKQVSEELGVRYVLEGGFQRSGERVRITAQLIDALTENHIWAERYERDLKEIFALQDEITLRILTAIRVKLTDGEQAAMSEKSFKKYLRSNQGLDYYLKILEATKYYERQNLDDVRVARRIAEEAVAMCPQFAEAYVTLGYVYHLQYWTDIEKSPQESIEEGTEMAQKALALDNSLAAAHTLLGNMYALNGEFDKAIAEGERAIALSPGSALDHELYGFSLILAGHPEEAIPLLKKAIRLNPFSPPHTFMDLGIALRMTGRFEEAVSALKEAIRIVPNHIGAHINLACTYSVMGRDKEARAEAAEVLRINPKFSLDAFSKKIVAYSDRSQRDKLSNALRKAGLK